MQTASSNLPVIGQVANGVDYLQSQLGSAIKDFKNIYSEFEDAISARLLSTRPPLSCPSQPDRYACAGILATPRVLTFLNICREYLGCTPHSIFELGRHPFSIRYHC